MRRIVSAEGGEGAAGLNSGESLTRGVKVVVVAVADVGDTDMDTDTVPDASLTSRWHWQFGHTIFNGLTLVSDSSWRGRFLEGGVVLFITTTATV